jgi:hypothetical protein
MKNKGVKQNKVVEELKMSPGFVNKMYQRTDKREIVLRQKEYKKDWCKLQL